MTSKLKSAGREAEARRQALLHRYDEEDLHQLRVNLRRIRSCLKQRHGRKAKLLRHQLGNLADATGAARDWDTLLARADNELGPRQIKLLAPRLLAHQAVAQEPVRSMLESDEWHRAIEDWKTYIARHPPRQGERHSGDSVTSDKEDAVERAWQRVQAADTPRNWHRLRIAIKELRYSLDEVPKAARNSGTVAALRRCKRLQSWLGDWHDTVVHLQLIQKLSLDFDPVKDQRVLQLIHRWSGRIERQGRDLLGGARKELQSADSEKA